MVGFIGVGIGRRARPSPPAVPAGGFYLGSEDTGGFRRTAEGVWSIFGSPFGVATSPYDWVETIAVAGDDAETIYAFTPSLAQCHVSHDGGATWSHHALPTTGVDYNYRGAVSPQSGHVYLQADNNSVSHIFKSVDDGATWTSIVDLATIGNRWGRVSVGTTKLWFSAGNTVGGVPWFHQCGLDGSSVVDVGPTTASILARPQVTVLNDDLALGFSRYLNALYLLTPTGYTDITPPAHVGNIAWAEPLTDQVFLCATEHFAGFLTTTPLYRTDDAGATWTLVRTFTRLEGFARNFVADNYPMISHNRATPDTVFLLGDAAASAQQIVWISTDGGLTWTSELNGAEVLDGFGDWPVFGPGGIYAGGSTGPA
jgi:hypothetical protein